MKDLLRNVVTPKETAAEYKVDRANMHPSVVAWASEPNSYQGWRG
jgi:hypothetical protein